jgi:hypothetical protein
VLCKHDVIGSNPFRSTNFSFFVLKLPPLTLSLMFLSRQSRRVILFAALLVMGSVSARASVRELPSDLVREVLSESVPTAFEVFPLSPADFSTEWKGPAPEGVQVSVVPGSIQWVRVSQLLVVPRARLRLVAQGHEAITLRTSGSVETGLSGKIFEALVPLFSGEWPPLKLQLKKAGQVREHAFNLKYSPAKSTPVQKNRVFMDSSCSPYLSEALGSESLAAHQWAYLGCRMVRSRQGSAEFPTFEVYLHWDGPQGPVKANGIPIEPAVPGLWLIRLGGERSSVEISDGSGHRFELRFQIPRKLSYASLGLGVGPYGYYFEDGVTTVSRTLPITTMYGSYFLTESSRLVFFDAFAPGNRWYNDIGFYFNNESSRALDDRMSVNILLGFHVIGFRAASSVAYRLGVPQGFELIFRDAFATRYNLSAGGFFYPPIAGKTYYNAWFRYGTSRLFAEINYIAWSELGPENEKVYSRSLGFTIGAPLFLFR